MSKNILACIWRQLHIQQLMRKPSTLRHLISARTDPLNHGLKNSTSSWHLRRYSATNTSPSKRSRKLPLLIVGVLLGSTIYYFSTGPSKPTNLNSDFFAPYTITAREAISPTSFIFTISPHHHDPSLPYLNPETSTWRFPLWSVEFKQPEVQIARHYTPLPPQDDEDPTDGNLRFYVRAIGGGEMSTYLSRLAVGKDVWLRGPHIGFDVRRRLSGHKNVVFLAGGTGIAPGMQVIKAVLDQSEDSTVSLLWAIRKREELQTAAAKPNHENAKPWSFSFFSTDKRAAVEVHADLDGPSPVARQLTALKAKYGERLRIQVAIDEEKTQFYRTDLQKLILSKSTTRISPDVPETSGCRLHDSAMVVHAPEFESPETQHCKCNDGAGKNLFMVSGPEGFITYYAGAKDWLGGQQIQGPVGGVAAQLQREYPQFAKDWLVLKL